MSSAKGLLSEMLQLLKEQVEHVVKGEHQQLLDGAYRHEKLLVDLEQAEIDATPDELREILEQIELEKAKLQSLLESESTRVDFMLRMLLGSRKPKTPGYPDLKRRGEGGPGMLNRRT
jgi:hypothetical protein